MLIAQLDKRLGGFHLTAGITVRAEETLVLVGESGSGKSTVLRLLAGLLPPDAGRIALDDTVWCDPPAGVDLPAWRPAPGWGPPDHAPLPHPTLRADLAVRL